MSDVTQTVQQIESGDPSEVEGSLLLVYNELRKLAAAPRPQEKPGPTHQATALVSLDKVRGGPPGDRGFANRWHVMAGNAERG